MRARTRSTCGKNMNTIIYPQKKRTSALETKLETHEVKPFGEPSDENFPVLAVFH